MPRILAIDYGTKRSGIAVTDSLQMIATGLTTVHSKDLITYLKDYLKKETVECVIIGEPKMLDNTPSESARYVNAFISHFKKEFPELEIKSIDERFTSKMAFQTMIDGGLKQKQRKNKELIDQISATILLQDYLQSAHS